MPARSSREDVLKLGINARNATNADFQGTDAPSGAAPGELKVVDKELKNKLVRVGAAAIVQAPQAGNPKTNKLARRPFIVRLYPKFDAPQAEVRSRASRTPHASNMQRGVIQIPAASIPFNHAKVKEYLDAVRGDAQREWNKRKQEGLTDVEFAKATKGLKGAALRDKMRELDRQFDLDFADFIRGTFPAEMITVLGIPDAGPDTPDTRRQGRS